MTPGCFFAEDGLPGEGFPLLSYRNNSIEGGWRMEKGGILGRVGLQPFCSFRWEEG